MKSDSEIIERIKVVKEAEFFGFETADLLVFLPFEKAKAFVAEDKRDELREDWVQQDRSSWAIEEMIVDYLPFAVGKAVDHRGISASRSVAHLRAWFWMLGRDDIVEFIDDDYNYPQYGAPILKRAHEVFGVSLPDDSEFLRMAEGLPCSPNGCGIGCGT